jgi:hypothetical protein
MNRFLLFMLMLGLGCSSEVAEQEWKVTRPPPEVPALGTAFYNDFSFKAGWSIALWDEGEKELIVGFLESEPTADMIKKIKEKKGLFLAQLDVPLIEFEVVFAEKDGALDVTSPTYWKINIVDKYPHPWTYNGESEGIVVEISGNPRSGGKVQGRFTGTNSFQFPDRTDTSGWNFTFDLPVQ